jgi:predicted RNase H-like HicB family nuclease
MPQVHVSAFWDAEASVWVAESDDVPGLITEAETMDALMHKLEVLIPELLDENGYADGDEVPFVLNAKITGTAHRMAA